MKTFLTKLTTAALSLAALLITGSAWAAGQQEQDENGLSPSFWYKFNGNLDYSGARDLGLSGIGTTYAEGKDGEANTAITIASGVTVNQGSPNTPQSSLSGNGTKPSNFTISVIAKIAENGQNKVILSEFSKKGNNDDIILAGDPINKKILVCKDATTLIEQSIDDITTAFHTYVVTGDGSTIRLYVDGVVNSTTSTTYPNTTRTACGVCKDGGGGYQSGFAAAVGTVVDDFRIYCNTCLSATQVAKIGKVFKSYDVAMSGETITVSEINARSELASAGEIDVVNLALTDTTRLVFDAAFKCGSCNVTLNGDLLLDRATEPEDFAKFDLAGVTGSLVYKWAIKDLPVGTGMAINFNQGQGRLGDSDEAGISGLTIYGNVWNNTDGGNGSLSAAKMFAPDGATVIDDTMSVSWTGSLYQWTTATTGFLKGYLDDSNITFSTLVPFDYYDVYIICATDSGNAKFGYKTINGVNYSADADGEARANSIEAWGQTQQKIPVLGKNVMHIAGLTASNFNLTKSLKVNNSVRGCIAAIVIVKTKLPEVKNVDCGTAYNISAANAFTEDIVNLNFADAGGTLTIDAAPERNFNISSKGAVTVQCVDDVSDSATIVGKLKCAGVEGALKFIFVDNSVPETPPAEGVTYRWQGDTALTAIPFSQDQVAGTLEIACPLSVAADAKVEVFRNKNIVFDGNFALNASAFICGNKVGGGDPTPSQTITQNAGAITLTKEYTGTDTTSDMPLLFAHWPSTVVYNLVGGSITAENGNVMFGRDGTIAMTVGGDDDKTATFKARGISRNGRDNTSSITISKNGTVLVGVGGIDFGANKKIVLNGGTLGAYDNATITTTMNLEVTAASTINVAEGKTLTLAAPLSGSGAITKTGAGNLVITGSRANFTGTITIADGAYDIGGVRDFATVTGITISGTGFISATAIVADDGEVKITNVPAGTSLVIYDLDGVTQLPTTVVGTTVTATSSIATDGEACLYDWTFDFSEDKRHTTEKNNYLVSVGKNKSALEWDTGWQQTTDGHYAERAIESEDFTYGKALNTKGTPYSNDFTVNYPTEWTCVVAGVVPNKVNAALIAFGTSTGGSIAILKGATDTEVLIARTTGNSAYKALATMQVANALTTSHTYAFVKTADSIAVYLDGNLWNVTPVSNVSFGNRVQVGSIHGGKQNTMIESSKDATNATSIQAVRIFEGALGPNALKQLADEFPYNSPNGTFAREFAEGEDTWTSADSWTNTKTSETAELPLAGATLNISAAGAASITVDLTEETEYEAMTFSGAAMTFKAGTAEAINIGLTTVATPITIEYGSISIANGPFVVSGEGSVAFDYTAAPTADFTKIGFVALTGTTDELADGKVTCTALPSAPAGRSISFGYSAEHKAYGVTTEVNREATTLYLKESATLDDDTLFAMTEDGEADMPRLFAEDEIVVLSGVTLTIPTTALAIPISAPIKGAGTIAVTGATLTEAAPLFTVAEDWAGAVEFTNTTVTGADLNKYGNENTTVKLAGVVGYLKNSVEFKPEVILANTATLAGLELTNGSSDTTVIFSKVSGSGNFIGNSSSVTQRIAFGDASEFTGEVRMQTKMGITLGSNTNTAGDGAIVVADGATITFASQNWKATNGVTFGDTLTVIGEVGSFITMPEPTNALPAITLAGDNRDYMLKYAEGKLTVTYAEVEVAIPEIEGTTVAVTANGEPVDVIDIKVKIPYGAKLIVTYTVQDGKIFKDGSPYLELEYDPVIVDPEIAKDLDEDDETVDAGAKIDTMPYLTITDALTAATDGDTVIVLKNVALDSLVVPTGVTLDLNNKMVVATAIENNGTIVVYDEATTMALVDTHGTIKFGTTVMLSVGYMFPEGTIVTVKKVQGVPGATRSVITVPENSVLMNLVGAAAKKDIAVQFEDPFSSTLLLAGAIERGSHDYNTILNVGGITTVGAPLIIGLDGEGMDYETYPNNKATLTTTYLQFDDDMVSELVGQQVYACIQLIPGVGVLQTATDLSSVIGTRLVTLDGAEIKDDYDGVIHTYTAEWKSTDPWEDVKGKQVEGFEKLSAEDQTKAQEALEAIAEAVAAGATGTSAPADAAGWIKKVYGDDGTVPATTLVAAKNIDISVKYDLPLMIAETPTIEIKQAVDGEEKPVEGFTFQIKDGNNPVSLAAAVEKIQSMVQFTSALGDNEKPFAPSTAENVTVGLSDDKETATATFTKATASGFMKVELK